VYLPLCTMAFRPSLACASAAVIDRTLAGDISQDAVTQRLLVAICQIHEAAKNASTGSSRHWRVHLIALQGICR
jgi:hypothetical protein